MARISACMPSSNSVVGAIELFQRVGEICMDIVRRPNHDSMLLTPIVDGAVAAVDIPRLGTDRILNQINEFLTGVGVVIVLTARCNIGAASLSESLLREHRLILGDSNRLGRLDCAL